MKKLFVVEKSSKVDDEVEMGYRKGDNLTFYENSFKLIEKGTVTS